MYPKTLQLVHKLIYHLWFILYLMWLVVSTPLKKYESQMG